jgi:hypothetical protein
VTTLRVLAALLALVAVGCMSVAIVGMVTGRPGDRAGYFLRVAAVAAFGGAVALNAAAH